MERPLPDEIEREVDRLFDEGEAFADEEDDAAALARFESAWGLLPEPKGQWRRARQILAAVADSRFHLGDYEACLRGMQQLLRMGEGPDNAFLGLRMGQCYLELGSEREAADWLVAALANGGFEVFDGEDPKYRAFLRQRINPPPGGWPDNGDWGLDDF